MINNLATMRGFFQFKNLSRYFENLAVLQIVGHEITSLKPLVEVSGTLEELWICEGPLKVRITDLTSS